MLSNGFLGHELGVLRRLTTPEKIQRFLDEDIGYNKEKGGATCRGPRFGARVGHVVFRGVLQSARRETPARILAPRQLAALRPDPLDDRRRGSLGDPRVPGRDLTQPALDASRGAPPEPHGRQADGGGKSGGTVTERLYYTDSYLTEFRARVVDQSADGRRIYLDRTAFYPTSGGQLFDTGSIAGSPVVDVVDEGERIARVLDAAADLDEVACRLAWH